MLYDNTVSVVTTNSITLSLVCLNASPASDRRQAGINKDTFPSLPFKQSPGFSALIGIAEPSWHKHWKINCTLRLEITQVVC